LDNLASSTRGDGASGAAITTCGDNPSTKIVREKPSLDLAKSSTVVPPFLRIWYEVSMTQTDPDHRGEGASINFDYCGQS